MANHPNRGGLSRNALELVATFSAGGIALSRSKQAALGKICRLAVAWERLAVEECNGDWPIREIDQDAWRAELDKQRTRLRARMQEAFLDLGADVGGQFADIRLGGDPRGATVKIVMAERYQHLHDDWGREGVCVPGS